MPRQTFYNLPTEKQEVLIEAGEKEFSRVPLFEASIANIVKEAGIPRGSFYQYFHDKEDFYFYILNQYADEKRKRFIRLLEKHDGNIFYAVSDLCEDLLIRIDMTNDKQFFKNMFLHLDFETERAFLSDMNYSVLSEQYKEVRDLVDTTMLNAENDEELFHMIQMLLSMMLGNIARKYAVDISNEKVLHNFTTQINLMKKGFKAN
ncbi:MAG TPA: TetR family transcriptional regulator [Candidatus Pseudogracilibacillus intestinigallinarum]|uniref:TetR family transcriptional regulator n=1 Tax=Candidatus Pseudogracilibacillus intestinigallinarum TaxID=2838742 RepID=A0A9D1TK04_9BACI|nr:TetR family transcriptional regulator [Candidatus Pseudogracilibacillus intestinigallinarum]